MHSNPQTRLAITLLITLISVSGIALPYPILAPLFHHSEHPLSQFAGLPSELLFGIALAIYPLGILIGGSFIGALSDSYGRRNVLAITLLGSTVGYAITAYSAVSGSFVLFCLARFFTGICEGNLSIARAIASDLHPQIDRAKSFSYLSATNYAGYLIGPLIGGYLVGFGIDWVFGLAAAACFICALLCLLLLPQDKPQHNHQHSRSSLTLLKEKPILNFFILYLSLTTGVCIYYEFYPLWLVIKLDFTPIDISWATVWITSVMIAAALWLSPRLPKLMNSAQASTLGMAALAASLFMMALAPASSYGVWFALIGISIAIYNTHLPLYLAESYPDKGQGGLMGLMTTTFCLGNIIAAAIGSIAAMIGVDWAIIAAALLAFAGAALFVIMRPRQPAAPELP
ncbi:MFS transporter [Paraferrimonas haliotis]|uniref:MFS transporter n=1 Tax=Paraferrimonas haliotis TaxID=2013866 RepID=UPI000BA99A3F|nr:MFS transporter [Paraferrimonas haliotis]